MLFYAWGFPMTRPTKDLDLLGLGDSEESGILEIFREMCNIGISQPDGILFLPQSVRSERIREDETYEGVRILLEARLGNAIPWRMR